MNTYPSDIANPYERLEVARTATFEEIENAYRRMAVKWHPDRHYGRDKAFARKQFVAVRDAYDILSKSPKTNQHSQSNQNNAASQSSYDFYKEEQERKAKEAQERKWKEAQELWEKAEQERKAKEEKERREKEEQDRKWKAAASTAQKTAQKQWENVKKLERKKLTALAGFTGISFLGMAYLGNEYILKSQLEREIRKNTTFYSESEKLITKIKRKDYSDSFRLNIQLEAMIKLANDRKYDASALQTLDEKVDSEMTAAADSVGSKYSAELRDKRYGKESDWYWHKPWLSRFIHRIFFGKKYPDATIYPYELRKGYSRAMKEVLPRTKGKYRGMKVKDQEARYKIWTRFNDKIK